MYEKYSLVELQKEPIHSNLNQVKILDEDLYNVKLLQINILRSKLINLGMKNSEFSSLSIKRSSLENCYLRYAKFVNVDFTGSTFIDCDLENAKFNSCNLRYVKFRNCKLNIKEVLGCLPTEANLKLALLKELRKNQLDLGDNQSSDELLVKIIDTEKELFLARALCKTSYYREKEDVSSRIVSFYHFIILVMNDFVWGYGLKLTRLFRTAFLTILIFAFLIYILTGEDYLATSVTGSIKTELNFWQSLYASYTNFTAVGYGHYTPIGLGSKLLFVVENIFGLIFFGLLISGIYRRIVK
ncbi:hypothetical protein AM499_01995 [Bacillus sp. FJAT-22090]|uniref:pentapeptide repeat-containing protein n=1 Tax=Bacillus sp. FJAT-22090 TaxID=1581038 RepID=UPI0006ADDBE2|nr:pentapeptide repeat-containing protein [Bacillus sp. FJAT-22090]ALC84717.1 hypothetical protein AM499_01995 [Bacillus sp. FJAT-22090]